MSLEIWARHYGAPLDEREIARHYTLTSDDLEIVGRRRGDATRLGYAMLMLYMRWPGRALEAGEVVLSGSLGIMVPVQAGDNLRVTIGGIGGCSVRFV